MKKIKDTLSRRILFLVIIILLTACSKEDTTNPETTSNVPLNVAEYIVGLTNNSSEYLYSLEKVILAADSKSGQIELTISKYRYDGLKTSTVKKVTKATNYPPIIWINTSIADCIESDPFVWSTDTYQFPVGKPAPEPCFVSYDIEDGTSVIAIESIRKSLVLTGGPVNSDVDSTYLIKYTVVDSNDNNSSLLVKVTVGNGGNGIDYNYGMTPHSGYYHDVSFSIFEQKYHALPRTGKINGFDYDFIKKSIYKQSPNGNYMYTLGSGTKRNVDYLIAFSKYEIDEQNISTPLTTVWSHDFYTYDSGPQYFSVYPYTFETDGINFYIFGFTYGGYFSPDTKKLPVGGGFLMKLDSNGSISWVQATEPSYSNPSVVHDSIMDGNRLIGLATYQGSEQTNSSGSTGIQYVPKVIVYDLNGTITSSWTLTVDLPEGISSNPIIIKYDSNRILKDSQGNFLISGMVNIYSDLEGNYGPTVPFIIKLDQDLNFLYINVLPTTVNLQQQNRLFKHVIINDTVLDNEDNVIMSGVLRVENTNPVYDIGYILKLTNDGNQQWCRTVYYPTSTGFEGNYQINKVNIDNTNNIIISGNTLAGNPLLRPDVGSGTSFIIKLDPNGNDISGRRFGYLVSLDSSNTPNYKLKVNSSYLDDNGSLIQTGDRAYEEGGLEMKSLYMLKIDIKDY